MDKRATYFLFLLLILAAGWKFASAQTPGANGIVKMDAGLDQIVGPDSKLELLTSDFEGGEGPLWIQTGKTGYLLFTGNGSRVYKWTPDCFTYPCPLTGKLTVFLEKAGQKDTSAPTGPGTSGLTLDPQGRIVLVVGQDHGVMRIEKDGTRTTVVDNYEGKRFCAPNDIIDKSDGAIYFSDTTAGGRFPTTTGCAQIGGPAFSGVYLFKDGKAQLLDQDPGGYPPNGIALSPNQKILYVTNGGPTPERRKIFAYDVQSDDTVKNRRLFLDLTGEQGIGGPDGMKIDRKGNVYTAATGGVWIVSPAGKRLGKIPAAPGDRFANLAFGDADHKTLYMVSGGHLWRIRLKIPGFSPNRGGK